MQEFIPGQRWVSDNDSTLGLGIIQSADFRTVQIEFLAANESRTYAKSNAPLTRVKFDVGDSVRSIDGWNITVTGIEHVNGTLRYHGVGEDGKNATVHESKLSGGITFNLPQDKLFAGQIDHNSWFELRAATLEHLAEERSSPSYGLHGPRVSLIAHQIYIASEVSDRVSPRVLLADEVGLGKTIEAGLILHKLILDGRVSRALIIVPEPLLHQWLVELLRRFNLRFTLIDEGYFSGDEDEEEPRVNHTDNPFDQQSLVLCGLDFACRDDIAEQVKACEWDCLIIDEAHHLQWSPEGISPEYRQIESLARKTASVLLLTATPEQLGTAGHFARLRLLDPAKFHSLESYLAEEEKHSATASLVNTLLDRKQLNEDGIKQLHCLLDSDDGVNVDALGKKSERGEAARQRAIDQLIDQHGTGRVFFRNTRANIRGFPQRVFIPTELPDDKDKTRLDWLAETLRTLFPEKVLLICAIAETAISTAKALTQSHGLQVSVFHEQMTIIERDRVAAWFADADDGPRILICSEIGSEGRNFQFLHNIVLFELPDNPDLLEQRIGRLDRIGQRHTINIHVPVAANTNGARLSHWYHHALNAFEKSCVTGQFIKTERSEEFAAYLIGEHTDEGGFIADCKQLHGDKMDELNRGRNRLLELNACRIEVAEPIIKRIHEGEKNESLSAYLEKAFDCFGVEFEDHSLNSWIVRPGDHLQVEQFPELPEDGITITTNRETALAREDMHFMTWEHPMVRATFDLVLNGEKGSVSLCALTMPQFPPRSILMEALFESNCPAPAWLGVDRYLRRNALRLLVDQRGNDHAQHLAADEYAALLDNIDPEVALQMIDRTSTTLKQQVQMVEETASQQLGQLRTSSIAAMHSALDSELGRLLTLKKRNPTIRDEEIRQLQTTIAELEKCLKSSSLKLSALRVIYTH